MGNGKATGKGLGRGRGESNALEIVGEQAAEPWLRSDGAGVVLRQLAQLLLLGIALIAGNHQGVGIAHGHLQGVRGEAKHRSCCCWAPSLYTGLYLRNIPPWGKSIGRSTPWDGRVHECEQQLMGGSIP